MTPVRRRDAQDFLRPAQLDVFFREKYGEILADDFLCLVALDALAAGIPGDHPALGVQHQDGVVLNFIEQGAVLDLAVAQRPLGQAPPAGIAQQAKSRRGRDQQPQHRTHYQNDLCLLLAPFRVRGAANQQTILHGLHLPHDVAKLASTDAAACAAKGLRRGDQAVGAAQRGYLLRESNALCDQRLGRRHACLLAGVVAGQAAHRRRLPRQRRHSGSPGVPIALVSRQHESAGVGLDAGCLEQHALEACRHLVGVLHPTIAFARHLDAAIAQAAPQNQDRERRQQCQRQSSIRAEGVSHRDADAASGGSSTSAISTSLFRVRSASRACSEMPFSSSVANCCGGTGRLK